jgi:hypothetical protein
MFRVGHWVDPSNKQRGDLVLCETEFGVWQMRPSTGQHPE